MQIHQMSVTYLPEQDRILMRINTTAGEESRLWLTRRLMVGLWPLLSKLLTEHLLKLELAGASLAGANPELRKMLADFRKEEFLQHADFETPYREGQARSALEAEPLLVTDVDVTPLPDGPLRLAFNERTSAAGGEPQPRSFQMEMTPKLMQGLMHLLDQALLQSGWRDAFGGPREGATAAEEPEGERPRYLN